MAITGTQYLSVERVDYFVILVFMPSLIKVQFEFPIPLGHREQRIQDVHRHGVVSKLAPQ